MLTGSEFVYMHLIPPFSCIKGSKSANRSCTDHENLLRFISFRHARYCRDCVHRNRTRKKKTEKKQEEVDKEECSEFRYIYNLIFIIFCLHDDIHFGEPGSADSAAKRRSGPKVGPTLAPVSTSH